MLAGGVAIQKCSESTEFALPKSFIVRDPVVDAPQWAGLQTVVVLAPLAAYLHEAGVEQDTEVLRDGGTAHGERGGNAAHGQLAAGKEVEDAASGRVADGGKNIPVDRLGDSFHGFKNR